MAKPQRKVHRYPWPGCLGEIHVILLPHARPSEYFGNWRKLQKLTRSSHKAHAIMHPKTGQVSAACLAAKAEQLRLSCRSACRSKNHSLVTGAT
eukprot:1584663-Heterocapsa_arctica.AAC.1